MLNRTARWLSGTLLGFTVAVGVALAGPRGGTTPPAPSPPPREFRAAWVATVSNLDWPSSRFLSSTQGQNQLIGIFDQAKAMGLNAIVFQVRPECDAFYPSSIEPWSRYLTGTQGQAPSPAWDPLQFAIDLAHARGMELHAWFNPYRAAVSSGASRAASHITNQRPDLVRSYGNYLWLDPGEPDVKDYSLGVVLDVVNRYDIDGVHFDDYFYPYPSGGQEFPDAATYQKYLNGGGTLALDDWRRDNVNDFIERCYNGIKAAKPSVKFGLSPFGIWRPGNPPGVVGLDSYASIYGDSKLWLNSGWVDYWTPQIYWAIDPPEQSFTALMDWWIGQNTHGRHIWPGMATYKLGGQWDWPANEIIRQVEETQARAGATGNVQFRWGNLASNFKSVRTLLAAGPYAAEALHPASPWLDDVPPEPPAVEVSVHNPFTLTWTAQGTETPFVSVVYAYRSGAWEYFIRPGGSSTYTIPGAAANPPSHWAVSSVDRLGNESSVIVLPPPLDASLLRAY